MDDDDRDESPTVIRQLGLTRWVGFGGGLMVAAAGVLIAVPGGLYLGWPWVVVGALGFVVGIIMALRAPGGRLELRSDAVTVRGLFATRTIRKSSITSITPWPFIKWRDARGRNRSTPVTVLNANGALPVFARHAAEGRQQLHQWAGVGGDFLAGN